MADDPGFQTRQGRSTPEKIYVREFDLTEELMGDLDLGEMLFLVLRGHRPDPPQSEMVNAVLVSLVEHGLTPSALAARLTYYGAPESLQGAVASGLEGVGSRLVGPTQEVARLLQTSLEESGDQDVSGLAELIVEEYTEKGDILPGLGHPEHDPEDPRTVKLFTMARNREVDGRHMALIQAIQTRASDSLDKHLPINVTGAIGAILSDMGFEWRIVRGFSVIARSVGLVGHLKEEIENPISPDLWSEMG